MQAKIYAGIAVLIVLSVLVAYTVSFTGNVAADQDTPEPVKPSEACASGVQAECTAQDNCGQTGCAAQRGSSCGCVGTCQR